tara:strand:- start:68 stop:595 length:528 start_codon:yes stop_codon:yes gene_type:complete
MLYFNAQKQKKYYQVIFLLFSVTVVSGCGFTPIYKNNADYSIQEQLNVITIDPISGLPGLHLRNHLISRIHPKGTTDSPLYKLSVQLTSSVEPLLIQLDNTATRKNIKIVAKFLLTDLSQNNVIFGNSVSSVGSFNVVESDFATITAEKNTMKRVSKEIANKIFDSLVIYFVAKT